MINQKNYRSLVLTIFIVIWQLNVSQVTPQSSSTVRCIVSNTIDGSCSADRLCPDGLCCSQYGYCGSTNDFCGTGCRSQCNRVPVQGVSLCTTAPIIPPGGIPVTPIPIPPVSAATKCVLSNSINGGCSADRLCPSGLCCSQYGYCGSSNDFCGAGCQSQCNRVPVQGFSLCSTAPVIPPVSIPAITLPTPPVSAATKCILNDSFHGGCSADRLCPGGLCCSPFGFCGSTTDFCGTGCQSQCDKRPTLNVNSCTSVSALPPATPPSSGTVSLIPTAPLNPKDWVPVSTLRNGNFALDSFGGVRRCGWNGMYASTYDDGPHPLFTPPILASLAAQNLKATFFWVGSMIRANPGIARAAFEQGHHIASHSFSHPNLVSITRLQLINEIEETEVEISKIVGARPKYFRPPFGEYNRAISDELTSRGYKIVMWSIDTNDWRSEVTESGIVDTIRQSAVNPTGTSHISLTHDINSKSSNVASQVLSVITNGGFKVVPMYICLNEFAYQ